MHRPKFLASFTALALVASSGGPVAAGPLAPPSGPVTSTYKTLTEVEPRVAINLANTPGDTDSLFKITQPGSYYLTGNVTGVVGKHGIEIASSGVTVDLNGFDLVGLSGMGAFDGISATALGLTSIEIRNGSIRAWGDEGVDLGATGTSACIIRDVRSSDNAGHGIIADSGCIVSGCTAFNNTGSGILAFDGCVISACAAFANEGEGIATGTGCTISGCSARSNTLNGILVSGKCSVLANVCTNNGNGAGDGAGVRVIGNDNRIEGNNCAGADRGIEVGSVGNIIIRNTCTGNTINWTIVAGNAYGPIVTTPFGAAVNGNAAPAALGSTDPNANFTY